MNFFKSSALSALVAGAAVLVSFTSTAVTVYPTVAFSTLDSSGGYRSGAGTDISGSSFSYQGHGNQFIPSVSGTLYSIDLGITYINAPAQIDVQLATAIPFVGPNLPAFISGTVMVTDPFLSATQGLTTFTPSTPIQLTAGTPYFLLISPHASSDYAVWNDILTGATGTITSSHDGGATWGYGPPPQGLSAFRVNVLVPEPSSLSLAGIAVLSFVWRRRAAK